MAGVALTARVVVAGSGSGANPPFVLEAVARFCREVVRAFGADTFAVHDRAKSGRLV